MKRSYSDNEKAEALAILDANGGNVKATSRQTDIPIKTLSDWRDNRGVNQDIAEIRTEKKKDLADRFEELAHSILDILPSKLQDARVSELSTSAAIAVDKAQLLRNKPTTISGSVDLSTIKRMVEERAKQKGVSYGEEMKNYLDNYAPPEIKQLSSELVQ